MTQPDIDSRLAVQEALAKAHNKNSDAQFQKVDTQFGEIKEMLQEIKIDISGMEGKFDKKYFQRIEGAAIVGAIGLIGLIAGLQPVLSALIH